MTKRPLDDVEILDDGLEYDVDDGLTAGDDVVVADSPPSPTTNAPDTLDTNTNDPTQKKKNNKKKNKNKNKKLRKSIFSDPSVAQASAGDQSQFMTKKLLQTYTDLTVLELQDKIFRPDFFLESCRFPVPRIPTQFGEWVRQLDQFDLATTDLEVKGSPKVLVITGAALRAVELVAATRTLIPETKAAKLFARHLKVNEQERFLKGTVVGVAVGTPNRILKLLDESALSLEHTTLVVMDCFRDLKDRMIVDMPECAKDLFTIYLQYLHTPLENHKLRLALF
ncbi:hypothetical protein IWQ61_010205 [Dispira simplex]|nr:hypothetical protein IWQ61_010205 [Dispira simplex]